MDGITYTASNNTATYILANAIGCDSVVTLNLTINNSTTGIDVISACDSITWMDGNTYTSTNSTATYLLTSAMGCDSLVTLDLTITHADTTITINGASITCNDPSASYQWIDCSNMEPISGETNQNFIASVSGSYAVIVTDGTCSNISYCAVISLTGINEKKSEIMMLYPNPNNGSFIINLKNITDEAHIVIRDVSGKIIVEQDYMQVNSINMNSDLNQGVYTLHIHTKTDDSIFRLVVIK